MTDSRSTTGEPLCVITRAESSPEGRGFERQLVLLVLLVLGLVALSTWLATHAGRRLFASNASTIDLLESLRGGEEGPLEVSGTGADSPSVPLGSFELEAATRYLMVFRAGRGGAVAVAAQRAGPETGVTWSFGVRNWPRGYQRFIESDSLPNPVRLRMVYKGRGTLAIEELSLRRMSRAYEPTKAGVKILIGLLILGFLWRQRDFLGRGFQRPSGAIDRFLALAVFATCLFVYLAAPVRQIVDSRFMSVISYSLIHSGEVAFPENFGPSRVPQPPYQMVKGDDGRVYHFYSTAPAYFDVPLVFIYELFGVTPVHDGRHYDRQAESRVLTMSAALATAALCVLFFMTARHFLKPRLSFALALLFAFATPVFSTLSRPYWSHTWASLLLAAAVYLVLFPWRGRERIAMVLAATLVSWAFFSRPQMALSVIALTVLHLALYRGRWLWPFVITGAAWAGFGAFVSLSTAGQAVPEYFLGSQIERLTPTPIRLARRYVRGLLGSLWSTNRGVLSTTPFLIWVLWIVGRKWRQLESTTVAKVSLGAIVAHCVLITHTAVWPGAQSFGARQWSDVMVWFFLLTVLAAGAFMSSTAPGSSTVPAPRPRRPRALATLAVLIAISMFINGRGAFSWETWTWKAHDRISPWAAGERPWYLAPGYAWNYRNPQYLGGLLPKDNLNRNEEEEGE